jgi:hypothetical protein
MTERSSPEIAGMDLKVAGETFAELMDECERRGAEITRLRNENSDLAKRAVAQAAPFYGATCPTYPNCQGGCGLGCRHEAEQARAPRRADDHMTRARRLVEDHIEAYGMVPHPDRIKEAIAKQSQESFDLGFRAAGGTGPAPTPPQAAAGTGDLVNRLLAPPVTLKTGQEAAYVIAELEAENKRLRDVPQGAPVAWLCTDERYSYIKGIVTNQKDTVDAWREGGIAFVELVPIGYALTRPKQD